MDDFSQRKNRSTAKRKRKSYVSQSFCFQIFTKQKKDSSKSFDFFSGMFEDLCGFLSVYENMCYFILRIPKIIA